MPTVVQKITKQALDPFSESGKQSPGIETDDGSATSEESSDPEEYGLVREEVLGESAIGLVSRSAYPEKSFSEYQNNSLETNSGALSGHSRQRIYSVTEERRKRPAPEGRA